ncbi:MAG: coenzyme F420-0:L-glutamate ligase [Ignisphaera sp.]|nr:coenzyme F420-0:L-glutamate ligase [Ignisphaera sp.]MCX8168263.1 coenzyme F420-0:L-glutamate ligase [Ignisphaera sp.]MDW8084869.1 coenzyme F420-0:L-glutamate ligase [Ignisphaera sp.]
MNNLHLRNRVKLHVIRRAGRYWLPGSDVAKEIVKIYGDLIRDGDTVVVSDKALSIALGSIYDESLMSADPVTIVMTFLTSRVVWGYLLKKLFVNVDTVRILCKTPLNLLAKHKKLALYYGGIKHFLKPVSESGIDTVNLPYYYVSIPLRNVDVVAREIKQSIDRVLSVDVNILVVDTDRCYVPKHTRSIALATRPSTVKGVIDFGVLAYVLGRVFRSSFRRFPTPTAYVGTQLDLYTILRLARAAEKFRGYGVGRNIIESIKAFNGDGLRSLTWSALRRVKHYPALILRFKKL